MLRRYILIILLLIGGSAWGQQTLSLQDCRNLAIQNNKKLKIADKELEASKDMKAEAFTKYLPSLDASGVYLRNQKKANLLEDDAYLPVGSFSSDGTWKPNFVMDPSTGQPAMVNGQPVIQNFAYLPKESMSADIRNTALIQVGLTQPVYLGGKIRAYNQLAGLSEQISTSKRELELQNIIQATDEAYWQVISLVNRRMLADKYVETLKKLERDINLMYETGVATKSDILSVKVRLNEAEMLKLKVDDGLSLSRMLLNQICGLSTDSIYPLEAESSMANTFVNIPKVELAKVYNQRPEITSLELATQVYKKKEKIALSEYLPEVAITANYLYHTPSFYDGLSTKFDGMWSVGIGVKAPIFHWGASRKNLRQQKAQTEIMQYRLEEAKEQIELQVTQSEFKIKEIKKKMEMADYNRQKSEENLKLAELGFKEGTIPVFHVLEAQTAWLTAHSDLIDAQIEMKLCEVYLQKAYGILTTEE
ncbi:TolC family protein [Porphyromonadaceae bacterium OttesenSCG-928-L07]|nr:TolC family protein [Porphyromonadaceae bacterium OttesenSCG-928-L07]MDL2330981.1 TolC family protein [Odoribacter sp. OttesenSCG-928-A06]